MKIGEVLKLTQQGFSMQKIAGEEYANMGHNQVRNALKKADCAYDNKRKGWFYMGDDVNVLNQSIYDFTPARNQKQQQKKKNQKTTKAVESIDTATKEVATSVEKDNKVSTTQLPNNPTSRKVNNTVNKQENKEANKETSNSEIKEVSNTISKQENNPRNKETIQKVNNPNNNQNGKPTMKKVTYEIEESFHDELRIKSIREKRTVSEIVNEIIRKGLESNGND